MIYNCLRVSTLDLHTRKEIHCKFSGRDLRYFFIVRGKVSNYDRVPVGHFRKSIGTCYIRKEDLSIEYSQCGHRFCFCDGQIALSFICVTLVRYILFKLGSTIQQGGGVFESISCPVTPNVGQFGHAICKKGRAFKSCRLNQPGPQSRARPARPTRLRRARYGRKKRWRPVITNMASTMPAGRNTQSLK